MQKGMQIIFKASDGYRRAGKVVSARRPEIGVVAQTLDGQVFVPASAIIPK